MKNGENRNIEYAELTDLLLPALDGIDSTITADIDSWKNDGPHMFYGIFCARVLPVLFSDEASNGAKIARVQRYAGPTTKRYCAQLLG